MSYGVATISKPLKIVGLFCKRDLQKRPIFCKETCNFKEPPNRSHPMHRYKEYMSVHLYIDIYACVCPSIIYRYEECMSLHLFIDIHACVCPYIIYRHKECMSWYLYIDIHACVCPYNIWYIGIRNVCSRVSLIDTRNIFPYTYILIYMRGYIFLSYIDIRILCLYIYM